MSVNFSQNFYFAGQNLYRHVMSGSINSAEKRFNHSFYVTDAQTDERKDELQKDDGGFHITIS